MEGIDFLEVPSLNHSGFGDPHEIRYRMVDDYPAGDERPAGDGCFVDDECPVGDGCPLGDGCPVGDGRPVAVMAWLLGITDACRVSTLTLGK